MYRALMLDYDGTVAKSSFTKQPHLPNPQVIKAINQAQKKLVVCIVTARSLRGISSALDKINLKTYAILLNGAQIIKAKTRKTIWKRYINSATVAKIYQLGKKYRLKMIAGDYQDESIITSSRQLLAREIADIFFLDIPKDIFTQLENDLGAFSDIAIHPVLVSPTNKKNYGLAIVDIRASKANALTHVAKLLNISRQQIIGVGDGPNDFPLLMASGLKIAMGNAVPELKAIADFIAPSVADNGVSTIINKLIL